MKKIKQLTLAFVALIIISCGSKTVSDTIIANTQSAFKIWGNCEMCKETIEGSLKVDGIANADWNVDTKIMSVHFDSTIISLDKIQKNIASVGYDNEKYKGDNAKYSSLPECCQYDRK